jgi:ATPase subunit of ABC transporter with duplicated ATPase domains
MSKPIKLENLSLTFNHKICFQNFSAVISYGDRIAVIGNNGSGKTALVKAIAGCENILEGEIYIPDGIITGYVPQTVESYPQLSGGQRFNKELSLALSKNPDLLILDEPTNHLDIYNRKSLMGMLERFKGALLIVSHDEELLNKNADILWHIEGGKIKIFNGKYRDYKTNAALTKNSLEEEKRMLEREKKSAHKKLMKQQERASKSRKGGEKKREEAKWAPVAAGIKKSGAEISAGKQKSEISQRKYDINERLKSLQISEEITPSFYLNSSSVSFNLSVSAGSAGYENNEVLSDINIAIAAGQKAALIGRNASGKTTLLRALTDDRNVLKNGVWIVPKKENIGYLDQHYSNLDFNKTVIEFISYIAPQWTNAQIRKHLNDFLFRKNEEVNEKIQLLSGGEKARLSLAAIACRVPQLLILDEITNNIDLLTKEHIEMILSLYPGSLLIVSHEPEFIKKIGINDIYMAENKKIKICRLDTV